MFTVARDARIDSSAERNAIDDRSGLTVGKRHLLNYGVITFGPFLNRCAGIKTRGAQLKFTGFALEFANPKAAFKIPVFLEVHDFREGEPEIEDYVCLEKDIPFPRLHRSALMAYVRKGVVGLEEILTTLYTDYEVARTLPDFLTELREHLPVFDFDIVKSKRYYALRPELAALGFDVVHVVSYQKTLGVDLVWIYPQDRHVTGLPPHISAGSLTFTPHPETRTLDQGEWFTPMNGCMMKLMHDFLRKHYQGSALEMLTVEGKERVLNKFKWTPLNLLNPAQLRQARIDFARKNRELLGRPRDLAIALRQAQLYPDHLNPSRIVKHLGSIIAEAKRGVGLNEAR